VCGAESKKIEINPQYIFNIYPRKLSMRIETYCQILFEKALKSKILEVWGRPYSGTLEIAIDPNTNSLHSA
jgi:hypothetical protein